MITLKLKWFQTECPLNVIYLRYTVCSYVVDMDPLTILAKQQIFVRWFYCGDADFALHMNYIRIAYKYKL